MEAAYFKNFLHENALIVFGILLLVGLLGGQLAHKARYLPRISGYILIGFLLGPHVAGVFTPSFIAQSRIYQDLAIGLILFELGLQVNLLKLSQHPTLLWTALIQSILVFIVIFFGLVFLNVTIIVAALAAALGISISPAITLLIAREYGARGKVVKNSLTLTAMINILAFLAYAIVVVTAQHTSSDNHYHAPIIEWLYPFYRMLGSILLAAILAILMIGIGKFVGKKESLQFILLVGMLVMALGLAKVLYVSPFLTMLAFGIFTANFDRKKDLMEVELAHLTEIFVVILFVAIGANLHVDYFFKAWWLALAFIILRLLGSLAAIFLMKNKIPLSSQQSLSLSITLFPLAGIAIALLNNTAKLASNYHNSLALIILPAVAFLEIVGPMTTIFALKWIGELDKQRKLDH